MDFDKINIDAVSYNVKDSTARQQISDEITARKQADTQLSQKIGTETTERKQADTQLSQQINAETTARKQADTALSQQIENLKAVSVKTVRDYGAKGDGTTNDTAAFTAALSATGVAIVPPGTYLIGTITLSENQKILGMGRYKTVLKYHGNSAVFSISGPNCEIADLTIDGNGQASDGIINNGYKDCYLHSLEILKCAQNGIYMRPTSTETATSGVSHLENIRSYLNGKYGIFIDHVADVCLIAVECVSNSQQEDNVYANMEIRGCAVKCVNSHFWNINDSAGYKRPRTSVEISSDANDSEFTNCHIEGGRDTNLAIGSGCARNRFTNCMFYASFGSVSVWNAGWQTSFIGCSFSGQAVDPVTKPAWDAVFSGDNQVSRMVCTNCVFIGTKISSKPVNSSVISGFIDGPLNEYLPTKANCLISVVNGSGAVETFGY